MHASWFRRSESQPAVVIVKYLPQSVHMAVVRHVKAAVYAHATTTTTTGSVTLGTVQHHHSPLDRKTYPPRSERASYSTLMQHYPSFRLLWKNIK